MRHEVTATAAGHVGRRLATCYQRFWVIIAQKFVMMLGSRLITADTSGLRKRAIMGIGKDLKAAHERSGNAPDTVILGIDIDASKFAKEVDFDAMMNRVIKRWANIVSIERIKQWWWMQEIADWGFTDISITDNPLIKTCRKGNIQFRIVLSETGRSIRIIREDEHGTEG